MILVKLILSCRLNARESGTEGRGEVRGGCSASQHEMQTRFRGEFVGLLSGTSRRNKENGRQGYGRGEGLKRTAKMCLGYPGWQLGQ